MGRLLPGQAQQPQRLLSGHHESSFGVDEPSTVARILTWIDRVPAGRTFFVTYLPIAGHHPYETPASGPFPDHDEFGRYRNALHYGDQSLGALMQGLQARGLQENTLWIVFGDHGEAFGRPPAIYQGRSMLDDEPRMALFFADYSLGMVGLRDGPMKFIYELSSGRSRLFNVEHDPDERVNVHDTGRLREYAVQSAGLR